MGFFNFPAARNDQEEQEEKREIKRHLSRKVRWRSGRHGDPAQDLKDEDIFCDSIFVLMVHVSVCPSAQPAADSGGAQGGEDPHPF